MYPDYPDRNIESDKAVIAAELIGLTVYLRICECTVGITTFPCALKRGEGSGVTDDGKCIECDAPLRAFTMSPPTVSRTESDTECIVHAIIPANADMIDGQYEATQKRDKARGNAPQN